MISVIIFLLFVISQQHNPEPYLMGEKIDFHDLTKTEFFKVTDFFVNSEFIYLVDSYALSVYAFDKTGKLINKTGRQGRGPGEFDRGPRLITAVNDLVFINSFAPWLHMYNDSLEFLENRNILKSALNLYGLVSHDSLVYMVPTQFYEPDLFILDPYSEQLEELELNFDIEPGLLGKYNLNKLGDKWIFSWYFKNQFIVYDEKFNVTEKFSVPDIPQRAEGSIDEIPNIPKNATEYLAKLWAAGTFNPSATLFTSFTSLENDHMLIQLGLMNSPAEGLIINRKGEVIQQISLPDRQKVILGYDDGVLFLIDRQTQIIEAFSLQFVG
jgi:hypothetical protein